MFASNFVSLVSILLKSLKKIAIDVDSVLYQYCNDILKQELVT